MNRNKASLLSTPNSRSRIIKGAEKGSVPSDSMSSLSLSLSSLVRVCVCGCCEGSPNKRFIALDPLNKLFLSYGDHSNNCSQFCSASLSPPLTPLQGPQQQLQILTSLLTHPPPLTLDSTSKTRFISLNSVTPCKCTHRARSLSSYFPSPG